jgi:hypothetical protein
MRSSSEKFVYIAAAMAFLQLNCKAGEELLKEKIVRETLTQNEPALIKVGTTGVTSLEFPYRIEAIDGYGFSATPGTGDLFQISYTKGANYFSVRALKPGATGNLTVVLDQKAYSLFFEESSNPVLLLQSSELDCQGLTLSQVRWRASFHNRFHDRLGLKHTSSQRL